MMAKTHAIPSLHRDSLPAKETGQLPGAASGNTTYLYCRAVGLNAPHSPKVPKINYLQYENKLYV
jgi:hypothetical protein